MMFVTFGVLVASLIIGWFGQRSYSLFFLTIFFVLATYLFLWEIYSPDYGFRMPWLQTEHTLDQPTRFA